MRPPHGQSRLRRAAIVVAAVLAVVAGAMLWAFGAHERRDAPADAAIAAAPRPAWEQEPTSLPTPRSAALPEPRPSAPAPLPALDVVPEDVEPPAPAASPKRLPKARTAPTDFATLDLTLLQSHGAPAAGVKLKLEAPYSKWQRGTDPLLSDESGRFALPPLPADTLLYLSASDRLRYPVLERFELTLQPGERRVLSRTLERDLHAVIVRLRDRAGHPVPGVTTRLVTALTHASTRTVQESQATSDADGLAHFAGSAAESVSITASHESFAPAWISDLPLDRDPLQIELVLDPGFPVEVEISDASGRPRDVDRVELRGSPVVVQARRIVTGRYRFDAFPETASGITAIVQGRSWPVDHSARQPVARIVVPAAGALSMSWDATRITCEEARIFVYSDPPGWGWYMSVDEAARDTGGPLRLGDLAPGDYLVQIECANGHRAEHSTRASVFSEVTTQVVLEP